MITIGTITLKKEDLTCHMHSKGVSETGKSKLIELICRKLTTSLSGYILIDPHGSLYTAMLQWFCFLQPRRKIYLLDTSRQDIIVGFTPFQIEDKTPEAIWTKVDQMVDATLMVWNQKITEATRIGKWLKCFYYTILEQDLSIAVAEYFLDYTKGRYRAPIIKAVKNEWVRSHWERIYKMSERQFYDYIESSDNRLQMFVNPQVRRILGLKENSLDLRSIIERKAILLVNLQESKVFSKENNRLLGTLLINELARLFAMSKEGDYERFYLIIDECQRYLTSDVLTGLDELRKYGLSMMLFHQRDSQLSKEVASALENAKTKITFSSGKGSGFKPKRHFEVTLADGTKKSGVVPEIPTFPIPDETIEKYRKTILVGFRTAEEVDRLLKPPHDEEKELTDEDFLR